MRLGALWFAVAVSLAGCELVFTPNAFPRPELADASVPDGGEPAAEDAGRDAGLDPGDTGIPPDAACFSSGCAATLCGDPDNCGKACLGGSGCKPPKHSLRGLAVTPLAGDAVGAPTSARGVRASSAAGEMDNGTTFVRRLTVSP